jgi:hypothetical protein
MTYPQAIMVGIAFAGQAPRQYVCRFDPALSAAGLVHPREDIAKQVSEVLVRIGDEVVKGILEGWPEEGGSSLVGPDSRPVQKLEVVG